MANDTLTADTRAPHTNAGSFVRLLVALALVSGCAHTGLRNTPATRYLGQVLDTRELGAGELERVRKEDPAIQAYVQKTGQPDFILLPTQQDVELIYYLPSVLVQFHRPTPDAPSVMGTLTPLPNTVLNVLPADIRAGTPTNAAADDPASGCWSVTIGDQACRTCCAESQACVGSCKRK